MNTKELGERIKNLERQVTVLKSDIDYLKHLDAVDKGGLFDCETPKYEFKVGDRVQFKSWEEMEQEFGVNEDENIDIYPSFINEMRHLCGTFATIEKLDGARVALKEFSANGETNWRYLVYMLKPATNERYWTFTEDEKVILRNLPKEYKWLVRDSDDYLVIFMKKPEKDNKWKIWEYGGDCLQLQEFNHLFQSINWEEDDPCEFRKYL